MKARFTSRHGRNKGMALRRPDGRIATVFTTELPWPPPGRGSSTGTSGRLPARGYLLTLDFAEVGGRLECVRFAIGAALEVPNAPEPEPVTASAIRSVPLRRLIDKALAEETKGLGRWAREAAPASSSARYLRARAAAAAASLPRTPGRPPQYSEEHFKHVADSYTRAWKISRSPTKAVATQWKVSPSTAAKWVARARQAGFLPPTRRGRSRGGELGTQATRSTPSRPPRRSPQLKEIERREVKEAMQLEMLERHEAWLAGIGKSTARPTRRKTSQAKKGGSKPRRGNGNSATSSNSR